MTNLQNAMIYDRSNAATGVEFISTHGSTTAVQPVLLCSHRSLPQKFGGTKINSVFCCCSVWDAYAGRLVEFSTDCTQLTFVLSLLKEVAVKWAIAFTEGNDPVLATIKTPCINSKDTGIQPVFFHTNPPNDLLRLQHGKTHAKWSSKDTINK